MRERDSYRCSNSTREEWTAKWLDRIMPPNTVVSAALVSWASPEEIADLMRKLKARWRELGASMKQAPACRPGYVHDHDRCDSHFRWMRQRVNSVIKTVSQGRLPLRCDARFADVEDDLERLLVRRETAQRAQNEAFYAGPGAHYIGDEAWQAELVHRASWEQRQHADL